MERDRVGEGGGLTSPGSPGPALQPDGGGPDRWEPGSSRNSPFLCPRDSWPKVAEADHGSRRQGLLAGWQSLIFRPGD